MGGQQHLFPLQSKEEAHEILKERRARLLAMARGLAYELGQRDRGVTTQEILVEMERRDMMDDEDRALDQRWIGALWGTNDMRADFERVGYRIQKNEARNCHAAPRPVWRRRA
jgi:hypothetical protein